MSLPHAILGLLQWQPMTGYDLKTQQFDKSVNHFWPADQAQIYRTLDKLVEQGWASVHLEIQHDRPNRKVYTLTEAGLAELHRWLSEPQGMPTFRDPFLIQVFFADQLTDAQILALLETQRSDHEELLAFYQRMPEYLPLPTLDDKTANRKQIMHRLVLEMVLFKERAYIDWLHQAISTIQSRSQQSSV